MKISLKSLVTIVGIPLVFALIVHFIYGLSTWNNLFTIMSLSFLFLVPFGMGALTIYVSKIEKVQSRNYRITMPWVPIFAFLLITLCLGLEGWACWAMAMPIS
jgi:amino acid transporter